METSRTETQFTPYLHDDALSQLENTFQIYAGTTLGVGQLADEETILFDLGMRVVDEYESYDVGNINRLAYSIDNTKDLEQEINAKYFGFKDPERAKEYKVKLQGLCAKVKHLTASRPDKYWQKRLDHLSIPDWIGKEDFHKASLEKLNQQFYVALCIDRVTLFKYFWRCAYTLEMFLNRIPPEQQANVDTESTAEPPPQVKKSYPPPLIIATIQDAICKSLNPYVDNNQHDDLKRVLNREKIEGRIWVEQPANTLIYVFKTKLGKINMTDVSHWLAQYFSFGIDSENPVSQSSAYDVLRAKNAIPRDKQIP